MTPKETDSRVTDSGESKTDQSISGKAEAVAARLQSLEQMDYSALHNEWRRLYRAHPPKRVARDLLLLGVAWKIQEQAYGGVSVTTKRRLTDLAKSMDQDDDVTRDRVTSLKSGAKLVREWRGVPHTVIVLDEGFEWNGQCWRSLSAIAREITGVHWSGPRFFGLNGKSQQIKARAEETADG